jgi:hypothetical protein
LEVELNKTMFADCWQVIVLETFLDIERQKNNIKLFISYQQCFRIV